MPDYNLNYVISENLSVYPCGNREVAIAPMDRLNTEYNIVSIVNRMVDRDSFVVSKNSDLGTYYTGVDSPDSAETVSVIFNIHGYIFRTKLNVGSIVALKPSSIDTYYLYAGISIEEKNAPIIGQIINEMLPQATDAYSKDAGWMDETIDGNTNYFTGMKIVSSDVLKQPYNDDEVYQWSMVNDLPESSDYPDADLFKEFTPNTKSPYTTYIIPILKCKYSSGKLYLSIPEVSRVKFQTSKQGLYRSVTIDDGVI